MGGMFATVRQCWQRGTMSQLLETLADSPRTRRSGALPCVLARGPLTVSTDAHSHHRGGGIPWRTAAQVHPVQGNCFYLVLTQLKVLCRVHHSSAHLSSVPMCSRTSPFTSYHSSWRPAPADDYLFKLLLIGDSGVGKSCLLLRFAVKSPPTPWTFSPRPYATVSCRCNSVSCMLDACFLLRCMNLCNHRFFTEVVVCWVCIGGTWQLREGPPPPHLILRSFDWAHTHTLRYHHMHILPTQDDTYTESYISTIGVDFVSVRRLPPVFLQSRDRTLYSFLWVIHLFKPRVTIHWLIGRVYAHPIPPSLSPSGPLVHPNHLPFDILRRKSEPSNLMAKPSNSKFGIPLARNVSEPSHPATTGARMGSLLCTMLLTKSRSTM